MSKLKKNLIIIFSIIGALVVFMIVFGTLFSLREINIAYTTSLDKVAGYEKQEIINQSSIKKGTNLVFASFDSNEAKLEKKFPFAKFNIVRSFPNKVTIYISERTPVFRVKAPNGMWHIYDEELKCLAIVEESNLSFLKLDVTTINGVTLNLAEMEGEKMIDTSFSQKLTTIIDGVYGAYKTPISIMSDITFDRIEDLGTLKLVFKIRATDGKDNAGTLVVLGESYLKEKIAYITYTYLDKVSQSNEYVNKLDKVTLTILSNFNPTNADTLKVFVNDGDTDEEV